MVVGYPIPEIHQPLPEIVQAQLRSVGIDLVIETTPDTASYEERLELGEGDLWVEIGNQNDANPCFLPGGLFYSKSTWGAYPRLFAPGAEFDAFLEACQTAVEVDDVKQNAAEAMRVAIDQENIVLPVAGIFNIYGLSTKVQGFEAHPSGVNQRWETVFLSE
jgi:ABC-type transport system substrate-binding protein